MAEVPNWDAIAEMDPTVEAMLSAGTPLTRENYIEAKYGMPGTMDYPKEWTRDHEDGLPWPFQRA